jgi:hypothetical protein
MSEETVDTVEEESTDSTSTEEVAAEVTSSLAMSDEEFMKMGLDEVLSIEEGVATDETEEETSGTEEETSEASDDDGENTDKVDVAAAGTQDEKVGEEKAESEETTEETSEDTQDYEAQVKRILSPFKANGKDISVDNVDEAISLMQMGANYNKKMAGLKPNLKLLKMLENNDLLDEGKISYLIDLGKKNPEAITKLIKESGINPLDIDVEADANYKPNTYTVNDSQIDLDSVLDEIRDTDTFHDTVDLISNKWDEASKRVLLEEPGIIKVINDHKGSGIYDQITAAMTKEKMLGRLTGLSDLQAYKQVGDTLQAEGKFAPVAKPLTKVSVKPPVKAKEDPKKAVRKKAASMPKKSSAPAKGKANFNPLSMSDEEFAKISENKYF